MVTLEDRIAATPIFDTLGFRELSYGDGGCRAVVGRRREYDGVNESFHGGLLMTIADSVAAIAVLTLVGPAARIATTDMSIRLLVPAFADVMAEARVIRLGRTLVPLHVDLRDLEGHLLAVAEVTYMRLGAGPQAARPPHSPSG